MVPLIKKLKRLASDSEKLWVISAAARTLGFAPLPLAEIFYPDPSQYPSFRVVTWGGRLGLGRGCLFFGGFRVSRDFAAVAG